MEKPEINIPPQECRYIIGKVSGHVNWIECFVTYDERECPIEGQTCLVRIGNKIYRIAVKLLETIAEPAP